MPPKESEQFRWFVDNVQPHEAMLRAWLRERFSSERDIDDLVQEAFIRVLRAHEAGTIESPKAFLFVTAKNLALARVRHRRVAENFVLTEGQSSSVIDESADVPAAAARAQELELLTQAIQSLPHRCRQIVTLRRLYGLAQKDVAGQLGISEHTVEVQSAIGLRKLGEFFERIERQERRRHG